jgi:hypothetical protein
MRGRSRFLRLLNSGRGNRLRIELESFPSVTTNYSTTSATVSGRHFACKPQPGRDHLERTVELEPISYLGKDAVQGFNHTASALVQQAAWGPSMLAPIQPYATGMVGNKEQADEPQADDATDRRNRRLGSPGVWRCG